jgi:co-chaperonin GroES (HSP10)
MSIHDAYQKLGGLDQNSFTTDPLIPDPENLPVPCGWNILVRPYPIEEVTKGGIYLAHNDIDFMSGSTNIGRVVTVGACAWNRSQHRDRDGNYVEWAKEGDFVSYPRHKGAMRKFKGVSFVVLNDDDIMETLPDPMVFHDEGVHTLNIPREDLEKYNTIYNPNYED